jgi:hypothetical protein
MAFWDGDETVCVPSYGDPTINCGEEIPEMRSRCHQVSKLPNRIITTVGHRNPYLRVTAGTADDFRADPCTLIQTAERLTDGPTLGRPHRIWDPVRIQEVSRFTQAGRLYGSVGMFEYRMIVPLSN